MRRAQFSKQPEEPRELPPGTLLEEQISKEEAEGGDEIVIYETLPPLPKSVKDKWTKGTTLGRCVRDVLRFHISAGLTPREERDLAKANVWVMDWEMDGGTLPPEIEEISNKQGELSDEEKRTLLDWFYSTAPGNF